MSRGKIVTDLDDRMVFHLPDNSTVRAVRINKQRMLGNALFNKQKSAYPRQVAILCTHTANILTKVGCEAQLL